MSEPDAKALHQWLTRFRSLASGLYAAGSIAEVFSSGLLIAQAALTAHIIDAAFLAGMPLPSLAPELALLAVATVARSLCTGFLRDRSLQAALVIKGHLRTRLLSGWLDCPRFSALSNGEMTTLASEGLDRMEGFFGRYLPQKFSLMVRPLLIVAVVLRLDPWSGLLLLVTGPLIPVFMWLIGDATRRQSDRQWTQLQRMGGHLLDLIRGLPTLIDLGVSDRASQVREVSERYRMATMSVLRTAFLSGMVLELAASLSTAVVAVSIGVRLIEGTMLFEPALFVLILTPEFYLPFRQFGAERHAAMDAEASGYFLGKELPEETPALADTSEVPSLPAVPGALAIELDSVSYQYPQRQQPALDNLCLTLAAGQIHVLAGPSGAGKSTLMRLLMKQMEPDRGTLTVGGNRLSDVPMNHWREWVTWVPQAPAFFSGSIESNVRMACREVTDRQVAEAMRFADMEDWLATLPKGAATPVGEAGMKLSGGQRQRIALARAYLRQTPLLFLDEPESGLDPRSEQMMSRAVRALSAGKTLVVIAHRYHTMLQADTLTWLEAGKIAAHGNPQAVLQARNLVVGQQGARPSC